MGISFEFEIGSMDSEQKSICNKEPIKANGQQSNCNDSNVKTAASAIIDSLKLNRVINLVSPISQEPETIVIDDHEPEEGEITNSDDEAAEPGDCEYEAISSDEEFTLRQKIEALEARNLELEKIASISSRSMGYSRSPPVYGNYKSFQIDDAQIPSNAFNRANFMRTIPPLTNLNYKPSTLAHVENISSDEVQLIDSENEYSINSGKYSRSSSHRLTKKEKRRKKEKRHKHDDRKSDRSTTVKQPQPQPQPQPKSYPYSSDSDNDCLKNREELKMALNISEQSHKKSHKSTLSHKLSALQSIQDDRKTISKRKRCKSIGSPAREPIKRKIEHSDDLKKKRKKPELNHVQLVSPIPNRDDGTDDELVSLEEQELRLQALKSAVLKKHEARKKRQAATQQQPNAARPYSPTDSVIADESGERSNDCIDSDNNNMDISPISSPGNQCQPMDMELASSNESSKSPVFCSMLQNAIEYEPFVDWGTSIAVPVPINAAFIEIDQSNSMNQSFTLQNSFPIMYEPIKEANGGFEPHVDGDTVGGVSVESEDELRAQLIEQMRNQNSSNSNSGIETITMTVDDDIQTKTDELGHDDTLEEDCLRSLLLSSKGKKSKGSPTEPVNEVKVNEKNAKLQCDDLPKLTMNLREALKRLKNNQQSKQTSPSDEMVASKIKPQSDKLEQSKTVNCDVIETEKTAVDNCLDKNKNELNVAIKVKELPIKRKITESAVPVKEMPIKPIDSPEITIPKKLVKTTTNTSKTSSPITVTKIETATIAQTKIISTEPKVLTSNLETIRKSSSSPVITTWKPKPVKKLIISLNADSSSDNDDPDRENQLPMKTDSNSSTSNDDPTKAFQQRLDQFLQSVRKNTDAIQENKKFTPTTVVPVPMDKLIKKSVLTTNQKQQQVPTKVETSKAVCHLPISSQLEYHRLITRMKLLEKQKEQKSRTTESQSPQTVQVPPAKTDVNFPSLTVIVQNDRFVQNEKNPMAIDKPKILLNQSKTTTNSSVNKSLAKHVLVKNTIENLISEEAKLAAKAEAKEITTNALLSVQIEQKTNSETSENLTEETTSTSISIAMLAKKTPKVKATVLANYEKRYHNHGEQYLNDLTKLHRLTYRTNIEMRKQQKLELELDELKKKLQLTEETLNRQKTLTKLLYPAMATAEKSAISNRTQLIKLESSCNRLGAVVKGTEYNLNASEFDLMKILLVRIICDKEMDIKAKLKQINLEKNRLKLVDPTAFRAPKKPIVPIQTVAAPEIVGNQKTEIVTKPVSAVESSVEDTEQPNEAKECVVMDIPEKEIPNPEPAKEDLNQPIVVVVIPNDAELIEKPNLIENQIDDPSPVPSPVPSPQDEISFTANVDSPPSIDVILANIDEQPQNDKKIKIVERPQIDIQLNEQLDDTMCGKYSSPLDHMQCDDDVNESSATDPDSIICPFDLMGRCEDKQCKYQHLSA